MNNLLSVPVSQVMTLTAERAVDVVRAILRAECGYSRLSPAALTISSRLTVADGGIDAEVNVPVGVDVPSDCLFQQGLTGFQLKSGSTFKPWTPSAIRSELLDSVGNLYPEVARLVERRGCYVLLCTGQDLTPEQRNTSRQQIVDVLEAVGVLEYEELVQVLGASQIAEFAERYPGTASLLSIDLIQEAWVLDEWRHDAHMASQFEASAEQTEMVDRIRAGLRADAKHIRVLGEPGLGKTRIVLEAVKAPDIEQYVLYLQHGSKFGQTKLFRQLIRTGWNRPLILILDELPESELSDVWRHLKPRCGSLKIISLDHGRDEAHDSDIERLTAPRLPDETIKRILANRIGESRELDRWAAICEGSPRVALAVADNLSSNPSDLLRPPATVPIWARFLHGYGMRDESATRQVDCVAQHLALFSRFGYEEPVVDEAEYISRLIQKADPTIGWARFQEIVQMLRARRVLQGSRTLFFVPKALHIYLWKHFWERYGRGFDFALTFNDMPPSLHAWFLNMFRFAEASATSHVVDSILRPDGIFSDRKLLTSATGTRFLSVLTEANPGSVLKFLESTFGTWSEEELVRFKVERQNIVWALEKIAVWAPYTVRAIKVLARFAVNENADFSNNSTGTVLGLFRIGPEFAATESPPEARLPALLALLRAPGMKERILGLKAIGAALSSRGGGFRVVGPEFQGMKERARLWVPATYSEWWQSYLIYFQTLVHETLEWQGSERTEACEFMLEAVENQIKVPPCTELAFQVLDTLVKDDAMSPYKLNRFFFHWQEYQKDEQDKEIAARLRSVARRYTQRDLTRRLQRYVIDVDWSEWDDEFRERHGKSRNRAKCLVNALARRIAKNPELFSTVQHLLAPSSSGPALWHFGEQLARFDAKQNILSKLEKLAKESKHEVCLRGYLSFIKISDPDFYDSWVKRALNSPQLAWLGVSVALRTDYVDDIFLLCLDALHKRWVGPLDFGSLRYGRSIESLPPERVARLFLLLDEANTEEGLSLLLEFMDSISFDDSFPCSSDFVFDIVVRTIPKGEQGDRTHGHYWKDVCLKLVKWDSKRVIPLLEVMLDAMREAYHLTYDSSVSPLADELARLDSQAAWTVIAEQFLRSLPKWRFDLFSWLKGGLASFDEEGSKGVIAELPAQSVLEWIEQDMESRAALIAHTAPGTLDDEYGGRLTRGLLARFGQIEGVSSGISATFHSGGWTGLTSDFLKRKREKLRRWLASDFEFEVTQWIEAEISYLDKRIEAEETQEERSRFD